jgi:predicted ATP-dependent endonuclease of OLD family
VRFAPGPVCALVGGPSVGKSNVLEAVWTLLQRGQPMPAPTDVSFEGGSAIELRATLAGGDELELEANPPSAARTSGGGVPVLFLPASLRSDRLVASPTTEPAATRAASKYFGLDTRTSSATPAAVLLTALEALCSEGHERLVLLIEEPELFLRPQAQRYLYRLLRTFAANGNQVLYSTHEPAFLNVGRLEELALVEQSPQHGTIITQPRSLDADASFRALSEIDAERGELFLARAVLLVEGRTEKLTLPFVFGALGYDADREAITIVDCGGKPNIPLFIRICQAAEIPCVAIYDRDAPPGRRPSRWNSNLNDEIAALAGRDATVELAPDFEAAAGLRGHRRKPARAFEHFSRIGRGDVPASLRAAVEKVVGLARA